VALEDELRFDISRAGCRRPTTRDSSAVRGDAGGTIEAGVCASRDALGRRGACLAVAAGAGQDLGQPRGARGPGRGGVALAVVAGLQFSAARQLREDLAQAQAGSSKDSQALVNLQAEVTRTQARVDQGADGGHGASKLARSRRGGRTSSCSSPRSSGR
jgi:hypothetical protein